MPHRDAAEPVFTEHLRGLAAGRQPDAAEIGRVLAALRRLLRREMLRRGVWHLPPDRLGVVGFGTWRDGAALDELVVDAYEEVIVRRLRGLFAQLELKPNVEGLIATNLKWFLRDLQKRGDPLGYRAWEVAQNAVERAVGRGTLVVAADGPPVDAATLLATSGEAARHAGAEDDAPDEPRRLLAELAARWNAALLPELVTAGGRGLAEVIEGLAARLPELGATGVETFRLRELVAALRDDLRPRWLARAGGDGGDAAAAGDLRNQAAGEPPLPLLRLSSPAADPEIRAAERDAVRRLLRCVEEGLAALPEARTRDDAEAVWRAQTATLAAGAPRLSDRELSRRLEIPRDRVPGVIEAIRAVTGRCRRQLGLAAGDEEGR